MDPVAKLRLLLVDLIREKVPVQLVWAQCVSSDIDQGTMTAMREDIEYHDVLLGLGGHLVAPTANSKVLLLVIENKPAATILLHAESITEQRINGKDLGGLVKADELASRLNVLENDLNTLKQVLATWSPVSMDGGAALKALAATWYAQQLTTTTSDQLQNPKVQHG